VGGVGNGGKTNVDSLWSLTGAKERSKKPESQQTARARWWVTVTGKLMARRLATAIKKGRAKENPTKRRKVAKEVGKA